MLARRYTKTALKISLVYCLAQFLIFPLVAHAITPLPTPDPVPSSYGLEATKKQPPPTKGATITVPGSGSSYSTSPITVSGICPDDLLVQVYNNGVMAGSVNCKNGSFSLQVTLYTGQNDISATVFDSLDQAGPVSNTVTVTYNNSNITAFGQLITLTSTYGRRSANPGATLTWPLLLSGGTGPYAFSTDWGDGTKNDLKSQAVAGDVSLSHVYSKAGIYHVTVKVTDVNGVSAFIQLVAIANGNVSTSSSNANNDKKVATSTKVLWLPAVVACVLLGPTFWLGRQSQIVSLRKKMEKQVAEYKET